MPVVLVPADGHCLRHESALSPGHDAKSHTARADDTQSIALHDPAACAARVQESHHRRLVSTHEG